MEFGATLVLLAGLFAVHAPLAAMERPQHPAGEAGYTLAGGAPEGVIGELPREAIPQNRHIIERGPDILEPVGREEMYSDCPKEISGEDLLDPNDPTSGFLSPMARGQGSRNEDAPSCLQANGEQEGEGALLYGGAPGLEGSGSPPGEEPQWGDDILLHGGYPWRHVDWDEDEETGYLYAIVNLDHIFADTNLIYRSTDGGENWSLWSRNVNSDGFINQAKIRVARDVAGETWICTFGIWEESDPTERNLWMGRLPASGGTWTWSLVHDNVAEMDADADVGEGGHIYVVYTIYGTGNDIWAASRTLEDAYWITEPLFSDPETAPYPQVAAGGNRTVYVAFIDTRLTTNDEVRVKRSTDGGYTWLASQRVSTNGGGFPLAWTDVASSHGNPQTVWIFVTFDVSSSGQGYNLVYYYSTDSGETWDYGSVIGYSPDDEWESTLRARKATGSVTVAYMAGVGVDSVMVTATTASNPTGFYYPLRVNDAGTQGVFPTAGWMSRGGWAFPGVAFDGWVDPESVIDVYFDWVGNGTMFVGLVPDDTEVPRGGTLSMTAYVTNDWSTDETIDFWTNVTLPNGNTWPADETLVGPITATIEAGETVSARLSHRIPGNAPLDDYAYNAFVGPDFPAVWHSYSFTFTVVPAAGLAGDADEAQAEGTHEGTQSYMR